MADGMYCEICGRLITDKGKGALYCRECQIERNRERNRQRDRLRTKTYQAILAEREARRPKLSLADVALYAKRRGITYGKAVLELEGRRDT